MFQFLGEYGLRNKREVWRVKYSLAKIRTAARELLTLEEKDNRRLFEGKSSFRISFDVKSFFFNELSFILLLNYKDSVCLLFVLLRTPSHYCTLRT